MKKLSSILSGVVVLLFFALSSGWAVATDYNAVVRAMLERSRLLDDVHFRVPLGFYDEYLRDRAGVEPRYKKFPPPVSMIAEDGIYTLTGDKSGKTALGIKLRLCVFDPEKCRNIRVLTAGTVWKKITLNGKVVNLPVKDGWHLFNPPEPGIYELSAEVSLSCGPAVGQMAIPILKTVRTLVRAHSPLAWEVIAGKTFFARGTKGKGTNVEVALRPCTALGVVYRPLRIERERRASYQLRGNIAWNITDGPGTPPRVKSKLEVAILGGRSERIDLILPASAKRVKITGPDVRQVRVSAGSAAVFLRGKISGRTLLNLQYELPAPKGDTVSLSRLGVRGGRWADGTLVITNTAAGCEVLPSDVAGLRQLAIVDIPPSASAILAGPPVLAYAITSPSFSAKVETINLGDFALRESIADIAHYRLAWRGDGSLICKVRYEIRNRTRQFLRLTLPAGAHILAAKVNDKPRPITRISPGGDTFLLPLVRSKTSIRGMVSFPVEVVYLCRTPAPSGSGEIAVPIPRIDLPIAYAWCQAYLPDEMETVKIAGPLRRVEQYSSQTATAELTYGSGQLAQGYERSGKAVDMGLLSLNYYRSGRDFYDKSDYSNAAKSLLNVIKLAPKSTEAANAKRMLANIGLAAGKVKLRSRGEKAAAVKFKRQVYAANVNLESMQQQAADKYSDALREGRKKDATVHYRAAEALGRQLTARGASKVEQKAIMRGIRKKQETIHLGWKAEEKTLLADVKRFKKAGEISRAMKVAKKIRDKSSLFSGRTSGIRKEMEEIAYLGAKKRSIGRRLALSASRKPSTQPSRTRAYDVRHLLDNADESAKLESKINKAFSKKIRYDASIEQTKIKIRNGQLVVAGSASEQKEVKQLIDELGSARGPQVAQHSSQMVQQQTRRPMQTVGFSIAGGGPMTPKMKDFIERNYSWYRRKTSATSPADGPFTSRIAGRLIYNLGQKVQVSSINLNADSRAASRLGITFRKGNNDVTYAIIDEGQFRTLMQIDAANPNSAVQTNQREQGTIVGTDALLANSLTANVAFADETKNRIDINNNPISLAHEEYILIDNGGYLTAVRTGQMQHWTERPSHITFAEVPQTIDVPQVGQLVRLEKTLVKPSDRLDIRITYEFIP